MADQTRARRHAILIGINSHDSEDGPGLKGCVRDVEEITQQLKTSAVSSLSIHSFTATLTSGSPEPIEKRDKWPTYDNICSCLSKVTQSSNHGDHVYIHFSGHSTVVPPAHSFSNWETGDLALVVLDGQDANDRYFHGSEIASHLKAMVDKGIAVTIVLDCCYSGSTLRNDEVVRCVPYRPELDRKYPPRFDIVSETGPSRHLLTRGSRQAALIPTWLAEPEDYAILTSSDATERSYDVKFKDGARHGTLTYFLLETFDELGGIGGTMHQLTESVRARILAHRHNHQTRTQNPVLFGKKTQLFFGLTSPSCQGNIPITRFSAGGTTEDAIRLHAGAAQGISVGDQFTLHPLSCDDKVLPVQADAIVVRGLTSDLRITSPSPNQDAVETGWLAKATTRLLLRQFPIRLHLDDASCAEWRSALSRSPSLAEWDGHAPPFFTITQHRPAPATTTYTIQDQNSKTIITATTPAQAFIHITHLATFLLTRTLSNPSTDGSTTLFKSSFTAHLIDDITQETHTPGCTLTARDQHTVCDHASCAMTVTPADKLRLVIKNLADKDGPRLFVYLFAMGSSRYEVEDMTKASRVAVPPAGGDFGGSGMFQRRMRFSLEDEEEECEDLIKVFVTRDVSCFGCLEMGALGERDAEKTIGDGNNRGGLGMGGDEVWGAVTFRIKVVRGG
ncbi:hypothetical protein OQA88_826 [Cercophora sp. LCS_1]